MSAKTDEEQTKESDPGGRTHSLAIAKLRFEPKVFALLAASGALLGLSAPGFDQWYLAWFGLVPLLLAVTSGQGALQTLLRGFIFGTAYSYVYLNWYLDLQPLDWLGFQGWEGMALATAAWTVVTVAQGIIIAVFSLAISKIPLTGSFCLNISKSEFRLPALLVIPLTWELTVYFIGNAHYLLGVPWTMLEYSQYKQLPLIQIASIIGGVGVGYLIATSNTAIAIVCATKWKRLNCRPLECKTSLSAQIQLAVVGLLLSATLGYGFWKLNQPGPAETQVVSVLQGNINIEMERTRHRYGLEELMTRYLKLLMRCPQGLIVWTENALPTYLCNQESTIKTLSIFAKQHGSDMVVGSMYRDSKQTPFNSAYGITSSGMLISEVYSKRYLVPFGEYTPSVVQSFPEWILRLTNTPAGGGFGSGKTAVALPLNCGRVAPLICFETLSPELCASSARHGGQLLVNISDLAWFHQSMIGQQMIAFSVFRAVENGRYFVFGANTGPSAIIDKNGRVKDLSGLEKDLVLTGRVALSTELTPFTHWFNF